MFGMFGPSAEDMQRNDHCIASGVVLFVTGLLTQKGMLRVGEQKEVVAQGMEVVDNFMTAFTLMDELRAYQDEKSAVRQRIVKFQQGDMSVVGYMHNPSQVQAAYCKFEIAAKHIDQWLECSEVMDDLRATVRQSIEAYHAAMADVDVQQLEDLQHRLEDGFGLLRGMAEDQRAQREETPGEDVRGDSSGGDSQG